MAWKAVRSHIGTTFVELPPNCKECGHDHWDYAAPNGIIYCKHPGCKCGQKEDKREDRK